MYYLNCFEISIGSETRTKQTFQSKPSQVQSWSDRLELHIYQSHGSSGHPTILGLCFGFDFSLLHLL
jgi:hypothetical protein